MAPDSVKQESLAVAARPVMWTAAGLIVLVVGSLVAMLLVFWWRTGALPSMPITPDTTFPAPKLQIHESEQLAQINKRDQERLHAAAALPIEQAMQRIVDRAGAAYDPLPPSPPYARTVP